MKKRKKKEKFGLYNSFGQILEEYNTKQKAQTNKWIGMKIKKIKL
ncbi:MAG: hypothetical protein PHD04_05275 [Candidatus Pacebacteria bacterium]|nr:hypothetical protein [Candidatus Paceibacterota bacterium]